MDTTVTGMFPDQRKALLAREKLAGLGYHADQVSIVNAHTAGRHKAIARRTADTSRGMIMGIIFGALAGMLAGIAVTGVLSFGPAVIVGLVVGAAGGAFLGNSVGRVTKTQVQDKLEEQVDSGMVMVSVKTDSDRASDVQELLAVEGCLNIVSNATSFTAGVTPVSTPSQTAAGRRGGPKEGIPTVKP